MSFCEKDELENPELNSELDVTDDANTEPQVEELCAENAVASSDEIEEAETQDTESDEPAQVIQEDTLTQTAEETVETPPEEPCAKEDAGVPLPRGGIVIKASHLALAAVLAVCLLVGGVFLGMWIRERNTDPDIDPNAKDYGDIYFGDGVEEGNISAPGYSAISFPANTRKVQMILPNPQGNPCYFRFSLVLKDTGEVLYRSGLIPPGKAVTDLTLTRPLEAGSYLMEIRIDTASLTDRSAMNGVTMEVELTVR